jgi:GntR family transcriptional regulator / MocR family aminotransferase
VPKRAATVPATGITLDRAGQLPMHRQLYQRLRAAILAGQLPPGTRLPSTRSLATELGVSRITALTAYQQLRDEGYLDGQVGAGTTVAQLSGPGPALPRSVHAAPQTPQAPPRPALSARGATMAGDRWRLRPPDSFGAGLPAFPLGLPAVDAFPHQAWTRILTRRARRSLGGLLGYQDPAGYRPLREAIAAYLTMARGVRCTPDRILVVSGAQAGLDLTARLLLDPGDPAWVEDPGYYGARGALVGAGARLVPVPVDSDGLDVADGQRREPAARLAYVTPSHQFPVGVTMSLQRRLALLAWADLAGGFVLEDDYESEYRYVGWPLPALQGLDEAGRVIYVGSFSKVLFPSLRIGYLVVPDGLMDAFIAAQRLSQIHVPALEQAVLADFLAEGHFGRHVRRMRALYAARGATLIRAIRRQIGGALEVRSAHAGLHLVGWLPTGTDDRAAAARAAEHGVQAQPLSAHALQPPSKGGLLLGYAAVPQPEIEQGARRLAEALRPGPDQPTSLARPRATPGASIAKVERQPARRARRGRSPGSIRR